MESNEPDNTIKEIMEEDRTQTHRRRRRKGCLLRFLIIAVILFIGFYGFILFRQKILDLEAEAIIRARQTLTEQASPSGQEMEMDPAEEIESQEETPNLPTSQSAQEVDEVTVQATGTSDQ